MAHDLATTNARTAMFYHGEFPPHHTAGPRTTAGATPTRSRLTPGRRSM